MFSFRKGLDVITLFHNPAVPASQKVLTLLKRASAMAGETATQDQASSTHPSTLKTEFELNITEDLPTQDQLRSILDYVGAQRAGEVIKGASDEKDALKKWKADNGSFERPLTVDWNNGKAVVGDRESEILKMLESLPQ